MANEITATVKITINLDDPTVQENALYLFTTALEGGINHWAEVHAYRWSKDGTPSFLLANAIVSDAEERSSIKANLNPKKMIKGLVELVEHTPGRQTQCGGSYAGLLMSLSTSDCDDYDAIDADIIAQYALGKITDSGEMYG
jgi:hypothetical protein